MEKYNKGQWLRLTPSHMRRLTRLLMNSHYCDSRHYPVTYQFPKAYIYQRKINASANGIQYVGNGVWRCILIWEDVVESWWLCSITNLIKTQSVKSLSTASILLDNHIGYLVEIARADPLIFYHVFYVLSYCIHIVFVLSSCQFWI